MTATHWLLVALASTLLLGLVAALLAKLLDNHWDAVDATLQYRTLDERAMAGDIDKLRAQVPSPTRAPARPARPVAISAASSHADPHRAVRAAALQQALADLRSGHTTANPHTRGGMPYWVWQASYARTKAIHGI